VDRGGTPVALRRLRSRGLTLRGAPWNDPRQDTGAAFIDFNGADGFAAKTLNREFGGVKRIIALDRFPWSAGLVVADRADFEFAHGKSCADCTELYARNHKMFRATRAFRPNFAAVFGRNVANKL
jgi:hypothetical protein